MDKAAAQKLVEEADQVCPYSNATRNNIAVKLNVAVDKVSSSAEQKIVAAGGSIK